MGRYLFEKRGGPQSFGQLGAVAAKHQMMVFCPKCELSANFVVMKESSRNAICLGSAWQAQ